MKDEQKFQHPEAYCLMQYRCQDCGHLEIVWNSRDGITPFYVNCQKCGGGKIGMMHTDWDRDLRLPNHELRPGDRYFRNLKHDEVEDYVDKRSKEWKETGKELNDKILRIVNDIFGDGKQPHLAEFKEGDEQIREVKC